MSDRNRWIALLVLCTGMLMIVLDLTIVNVALPSIQADLGFTQAGLAWVVNAYLIAFAGLLLLAGRLAGLAVFTVASLACGLAANQATLVAARFLQGMGGALTSAVILGMIVTMFPQPREQAKAIGVFTIVDPAAQEGWLATRTLALGAASLALLGGFIVRQMTARQPLMPPRIFTSRAVTGANLVQVFGTAGMFGMFFLGSLYLREITGYGPLQIGLAFLPVAVVMGALSVRCTDRLVMRFGASKLIIAGLGLIAAALALFALAPAHGGTYLTYVLPVALLMGAGAGLCFPALMTLAVIRCCVSWGSRVIRAGRAARGCAGPCSCPCSTPWSSRRGSGPGSIPTGE